MFLLLLHRNYLLARSIPQTPSSESAMVSAIKFLPSGKAAGIDGIPAEFYKSNLDMAAKVLQPILEEAWSSEAFPEECTDGIIVKISKKRVIHRFSEEYASCPQSPKSSPKSFWIG